MESQRTIAAALSALRQVPAHEATTEHIERAEAALAGAGEDDSPEATELRQALGAALLELRGRSLADNVHRARQLYTRALRGPFSREAALASVIGLANCVIRDPGPGAQDAEEALAALKEVGARCSDLAPIDHATVLSTRAKLIQRLPFGSKMESLAKALLLQKRAVEVLRGDDDLAHSPAIGRALHNLGCLYLEQRGGVRSEHVNSAVMALQEARALRNADDDPAGLARTLRALTLAYPEWSGADSLRHARELTAEAAAAAVSLETDSAGGWAALRRRTSALRADLSHLEGADPRDGLVWLEMMLEDHRRCLAAIPEDTMPEDWGVWKGGEGRVLGAAYLYCGRREGLRAAFDCFDAAIQRVDPEVHPRLWRDLQHRSGELAHASEDWVRSQHAHAAALSIGDRLFASAATPASRASELSELRGFALFGAYAAARATNRPAAVKLAEWGLGQSFSEDVMALEITDEAVGSARRRVLDLEARLRAEAVDPAEKLRASLADHLRVPPELLKTRTTKDPQGEVAKADAVRAEIAGELVTARKDLRAAIGSALRSREDGGVTHLEGQDVVRIATLAGHPLIYLLPSMHNIVMVAVVPDGSIRTLTVNGFTSAHLRALLHGADELPGYLSAVARGNRHLLRASLRTAVPVLAGLLEPVDAWVAEMGYGSATLLPMGSLGQLPLHAVVANLDVVFQFAPSARVVGALLGSRPREKERRLVAVVDPDRSDIPPLPFARAEAALVAETVRAAGGEAELLRDTTTDDIFANVEGASYLHFACHAEFRRADPLGSRIFVGEEAELSLAELLGRGTGLDTLEVAVLSACQTAQKDTALPDESIGFHTALLTHGVRAVVSTAWEVVDEAALLFCDRFYEHLLGGLTPAAATRLATRWLHEVTAAEVAAVARNMRARLRPKATDDEDTLTLLVADYARRGSERPFAAWEDCAAFACYGV